MAFTRLSLGTLTETLTTSLIHVIRKDTYSGYKEHSHVDLSICDDNRLLHLFGNPPHYGRLCDDFQIGYMPLCKIQKDPMIFNLGNKAKPI